VPLIRITLMGDVLSGDQKRQLARRVTDAIAAAPGAALALADPAQVEAHLA